MPWWGWAIVAAIWLAGIVVVRNTRDTNGTAVDAILWPIYLIFALGKAVCE